MSEWLENSGGQPFTAFGLSHLTMLLIYFIGLIFLLLFYKRIRNNKKVYNGIRWILFSSLFLCEITYQIWAIINGIWSASEYLPLHLCRIAGIIAAIALVTMNKRLIITVYFIGFVPAILALITPGLVHDFPHFLYWKFFIHHISISWASIFLVLTSDVKINLKNVLETYGFLLIYAIFIGLLINPAFNANYLYLANTPDVNTPLDLLGNGIWYYINLCLLGIAVFMALLGLYKLATQIGDLKKPKRFFDPSYNSYKGNCYNVLR